MKTQLTKEAIDDSEETAHRADHRRDYLITSSQSIATRLQLLWSSFSWGRGQLKG